MARVAKQSIEREKRRGETTVLADLHQNGDCPISAREIWQAAQQGDALAQRLVRQTGCRLGEIMAILIDLLNPECIIVGGLALRMGEALLAPARDTVKQEALPSSAKVCRISASSLGEQIGDIAALCVATGEMDDVQ